MTEIQNSKHVQSHQTIISNWSKNFMPAGSLQISDHQQNWGYEDGPWKGPRPSLLVAADFKTEIFLTKAHQSYIISKKLTDMITF